MSKKVSRLLGVVATIAVGAMMVGGVPAANAAPGTIDPAQKVNLNIVRATTPTGSPLAPTGQIQVLPAGSTTVQNAQIRVRQVTNVADMTTNAGWQDAAEVAFDPITGTWTKNGAPWTPTFAAGSTGTTDANGVPYVGASPAFQNMDIGLYFVEEISTPSGHAPIQPFVIALPMTDPVNLDAWLYSVHVYPKSSTLSFTKTVNDTAAFNPGGTNHIVWTLNASVPRVNTSGNPATPVWAAPSSFVVTDHLASSLAAVSAGDVAVNIVDGLGANLGTQPIAGTDYTLSVAGNVVTVTFTNFSKLQAAAATANSSVKVTITTTPSATASGPAIGDILNGTGNGTPTETSFASTTLGHSATLYPATSVKSVWQNVSFTKQSNAGTPVPLSGAVFKLYKTKANADADTGAVGTSAPSNGSGGVVIRDIRVSDFENNAVLTLANQRVYWLAETTAPAGFELLAEAIPVVLNSDGTLHRVTTWSGSTPTATAPLTAVTNVPANAGLNLPLTGGIWMLILTAIGAGGLVVVVARRNRKEANN